MLSDGSISLEEAITPVGILGDGCAALSFAARAGDLPGFSLTIYQPDRDVPEKDHIWGFWGVPYLDRPACLAFARWQKWQLVSHDRALLMTAETHPYHALRRSDWIADCRRAAISAGVGFASMSLRPNDPAAIWFDSRPPVVPDGMMLQHFVGLEVQTDSETFTPDTATLMDFRVDQSRGMHFIYLLPFSETEALVESTLFTPQREPDQFYIDAIDDYLKTHLGVETYKVTHQERGAIPLGMMERHDPKIAGIGGNGGAIRPSSGYAFAFIQKQLDRAIAGASHGRLNFAKPHQCIDLWMDAVLLQVLRHHPETAPDLFLRMAGALTGDQFARFLSGEADWSLRLKVIMAMPKRIFMNAAMRLLLVSPGLTTKAGRAWR